MIGRVISVTNTWTATAATDPPPHQVKWGHKIMSLEASRKWSLPESLQLSLSTGESAFAQMTMQNFLGEFLILFKSLRVA